MISIAENWIRKIADELWSFHAVGHVGLECVKNKQVSPSPQATYLCTPCFLGSFDLSATCYEPLVQSFSKRWPSALPWNCLHSKPTQLNCCQLFTYSVALTFSRGRFCCDVDVLIAWDTMTCFVQFFQGSKSHTLHW